MQTITNVKVTMKQLSTLWYNVGASSSHDFNGGGF
jgi:hypothetical protein